MQSLDEKTWKQFGMSEVFREIYISPANDLGKMASGDTPCIGRSQSNNGFAGEFEIERKKINKGGCITVSMVGVPRAFFQKHDFGCSQNILIMRNDELGGAILQALCPVLNLQLKQYNYGYPVSLERFNKKRLMLPVTDSGEPDYAYMTEYTRQMREAMLAKYRAYVEERIAELGEYVEIPALNEKEWNSFEIGQIFKTNQRGNKTYMPTGALIDANKIGNGKIPRIRVTAQNNGINGFTSDSDDSSFRTFENFVSVSFLGSAFYHPYKASLDMKVHCLQLRSHKMNASIGLFIAVMMQNNTQGTTYGNQLSSEDLVSKRVFLPGTDSGEPDYEYMEQYVKNMMLRKYRQYLTFLEQSDQDTQQQI